MKVWDNMQEITTSETGKSPLTKFGKLFNKDTWTNIFTGMGILGQDKTASTTYSGGPLLTRIELDNLYTCEGMAATIVDTYVKDMHRGGFKITGDEDDYLKDELKKLKYSTVSPEGITWSYVYGGGLFVFGLADGSNDLSEPLNENSIQSFDFVKVFDRYEASVAEWDLNPESPNSNEPKMYQISTTTGISFRVHASRTARLNGGLLPNRFRRANQGWGQSLIQKIHTQLKQLGAAFKGTENIIDDFITATLKVKDLADLLQADDEGENLVQKRMQLLDLTKHIINTVLIDTEEEYEKKASSVSGLPQLLDKFILSLSSVSNQPVSVMMGQSPSGLNATGDNDIRSWYDTVNYEQNTRIEPPLMRILELLMMVKGSPFGGKIDKTVEIEFTPLWQPTEKEKAETEKVKAETAQIYNVAIGAIVTEEVRNDLDVRDVYELDAAATIVPPVPPVVQPVGEVE